MSIRRTAPLLVLALVISGVVGLSACSGGTLSSTEQDPVLVVATSLADVSQATSDTGRAASEQPETTVGPVPVSPAEIVAAKVSGSVVHVRVKGVAVSPFFGQEQYEGVGSGIVYTSDGYILTNDHVVSTGGQAADSVMVTFATGESVEASIVARDQTADIALLKVDKTGLVPVAFADPEAIQVGQWAIAIGSPLDYRNSVSEGIVSGLDRDLETGDADRPGLTGLLQTDAAISPGNSGGGLFNAAGELIGMPEAYLSAASGAENIGFAIPADRVLAIAETLLVR